MINHNYRLLLLYILILIAPPSIAILPRLSPWRLAAPHLPPSTLTLTLEEPSSSSSSSPSSAQPAQTLVLRLKRPKKKVSWKEGTVDNEFLNRKSSKKCCIFHKELPFDDDCSDDEDGGGGGGRDPPPMPHGGEDGAGPSRCCPHGGGH
uniref:Type 1 phosphatases regulator ypi1 n=1 Tax=Ananas comosus var. bracteatus TaxID=296719 RepID=A0A6V7NGL8_ANACO|nr:unnamed protein product [Ananas comosus var. bracteatus]